MKIRRSYIILDLLAAACFAGVHYLKEFARTKLGFVRWLNYNGNKLNEAVPVGKIKFIMLAVVMLLVVIAVLITSRRKLRAGINGIVMCAVMIAAAVYYVYASVAFDYAYSQAYFLIVPVTALGTLLLAVRTIIPPLVKTEPPAAESKGDEADTEPESDEG